MSALSLSLRDKERFRDWEIERAWQIGFSKVASKTCQCTLTLLDVERSSKVTDIGAEFISKFEILISLDIFHTSISLQGKARLITELENLEKLPRGDFLCDALEEIQETNPDLLSRYTLKYTQLYIIIVDYYHIWRAKVKPS